MKGFLISKLSSPIQRRDQNMIGRRELETQTDHLSPVKNEKKNFCQKQTKIVIVFDAFVIRYFFFFISNETAF